MTQTEALRLALEALEKISMGGDPRWADQAMTAIEAVLEAKDEPYGYVWFTKQMEHRFTRMEPNPQMGAMHVTPVYTTPPQRTWVGLTDEDELDWEEGGNLKDLVKAIEAKLRERNT